MANVSKGLAVPAKGLLRTTTPPDAAAVEPAAAAVVAPPVDAVDAVDVVATGEVAPLVDAADKKGERRVRGKKEKPKEETRGHKYHLPERLHDRLWMLARQRRTSISAVLRDVLEKNLPEWDLTRKH